MRHYKIIAGGYLLPEKINIHLGEFHKKTSPIENSFYTVPVGGGKYEIELEQKNKAKGTYGSVRFSEEIALKQIRVPDVDPQNLTAEALEKSSKVQDAIQEWDLLSACKESAYVIHTIGGPFVCYKEDKGMVFVMMMERGVGIEHFQFQTNGDHLILLLDHVTQGLRDLRKKNIAFLDLKRTNIIWNKKASAFQLIDFGLAKYYGEYTLNHLAKGTCYAPETLTKGPIIIDEKIDVWTIGVLLAVEVLKAPYYRTYARGINTAFLIACLNLNLKKYNGTVLLGMIVRDPRLRQFLVPNYKKTGQYIIYPQDDERKIQEILYTHDEFKKNWDEGGRLIQDVSRFWFQFSRKYCDHVYLDSKENDLYRWHQALMEGLDQKGPWGSAIPPMEETLKELIKGCLELDPKVRFSLDQVLEKIEELKAIEG